MLRKSFWNELLDRASGKTDLHSGISPGVAPWIGTGAGMGGLSYNYVIVKDAASVELYIDRGKGKKAENKKLFDSLHTKKDEIENAFGGQLEWERLDSKRACRIVKRFQSRGYRNDKSEWPQLQNAMIDAMICLEESLSASARIAEVRAVLSSSE